MVSSCRQFTHLVTILCSGTTVYGFYKLEHTNLRVGVTVLTERDVPPSDVAVASRALASNSQHNRIRGYEGLQVQRIAREEMNSSRTA